MAATIAYMMYAWRLRHEIAIERIRSQIATDLHDDIGAGLSRIVIIGETLKRHAPSGSKREDRLLDDIIQSSRGLVSEIADIVWSMNPRRDYLRDLAAKLRAFGSDILEPHGIQWMLDAPDELLDRTLSPEVRRQVYLIFKEAIHNVSKHSSARSALLRLWIDGGTLHGELVDDGLRADVTGSDGTGLRSMRSRAEQLGGSFEFTSAEPHGAVVSVSVPLARSA